MKNVKLLLLILILLCMKSTYVSAQSNVTVDEKTMQYLKKFREGYIKSVLEKKIDGVQSYYADNVRLMTEFQKTVIGKKNVLMYYQAFFEDFDISSYKRSALEILDLGSRIVEHGTFVMELKSKSLNKEYTMKGKYQNIWEKFETGLPLLITEGWNYDHKVDIADQLKFDEVPVVDVALQAHLPVNSNISFELAALNRLLELTISQHDAKIWSQFYSDEGILFPKGNALCRGRIAIDEYIEMHTKGLPVFEGLDIRNDRIDNLAGYVIEYASHIANWRSGEYSGAGLGKDLRIWRREKDGSLKIFRHIGMND